MVDWDAYRSWAEGPSDVCAAHRCVAQENLDLLGLDGNVTIFVI